MKQKPILLTDLDDTLFPFADTWAQWQYTSTGNPIDEAMYWVYDVDAYLHNFLELQPSFINEVHLFEPLPVEQAHAALMELSHHYEVRALTARNHDEWSEHTESWVRTHAPYITEIHYTRMTKGGEVIPKATLAKKMKAHALIDDTKFWIEGLPSSVKGYIAKRPRPFPSDEGAVEWDFIKADLLKDVNS
jgi:5'(3')-deoxyribonucleotidase